MKFRESFKAVEDLLKDRIPRGHGKKSSAKRLNADRNGQPSLHLEDAKGKRITAEEVDGSDAVAGARKEDPAKFNHQRNEQAAENQRSAPPQAIAPVSRVLTIHSPYTTFRDYLHETMTKHHIGLERNPWLPKAEQRRLTTEEEISKLSTELSSEVVVFLHEDAPLTFLATVYAIEQATYGVQALEAFKRHNFTDQFLELSSRDRGFCGVRARGCCTCEDIASGEAEKCRHDEALNVFHHSFWTNVSLGSFFKTQRSLCPQYLDEHKFLYDGNDIEKDSVQPLILDDSVKGRNALSAGNFSEVRRAWLLRDRWVPLEEPIEHATASKSTGMEQGEIVVAVKTLKAIPQKQYEVSKEWRKEALANQAFSALWHANIVRGIAAFHKNDLYHFVFEWANGKSLRQYWARHKRPKLNAALVKGVVGQLRGLADALYNIHAQPKPMDSSNTPSRHGSISAHSDTQDFATSVKSRWNSESPVSAQKISRNAQEAGSSLQLPDGARPRPQGLEPNSMAAIEHINSAYSQQDIPSFRFDTSEGQPQRENWRHGDIKPENILLSLEVELEMDDTVLDNPSIKVAGSSDAETMSAVSEEGEAKSAYSHNSSAHDAELGDFEVGTWKLADFGRAKQNANPTHIRTQEDIDGWHTRQYEPPDVSLGFSQTSRLYDIWSLGCVFFETVVWLLYGQAKLTKYKTDSFVRSKEGSFYWTGTREAGNIGVSQTADIWMNHILNNDPECNEKTNPSALRDVMLLVQKHMLVIKLREEYDVFQEGRRANAQYVVDALNSMLAHTETDYWSTGRDREDAKPPSSPSNQTTSGSSAVSSSKGFSQGGNSSLHPNSAGALALVTERRVDREQYRHTFSDGWLTEEDDDFATRTVQAVDSYKRRDFTESKSKCFPDSTLCKVCQRLNPYDKMVWQPEELANGLEEGCPLCQLLDSRKSQNGLTGELTVARQGGRLMIEGKDVLLRVGRNCFTKSTELPGTTPHFPIRMPWLFKPGDNNSGHTKLMQQWLSDCDSHGCMPQHGPSYCPRRLLKVREPDGSSCCRLVYTESLENKGEGLQYIAFSHPWGPNPADHFKSTTGNINQHMQGIDESKLPRNFRDAITVTRRINKSYLWIDSICVCQISRDDKGNTIDKGDFLDEADYMKDIFNSAYCVLAASNATAMTTGFLDRPHKAKLIGIPKITDPDDAEFYVSDQIDGFKRDVEEEFLSQRGWAFQERALARRTIFFTNNQTYFECGVGIRCETLSKLKNAQAAFLGDPEFPQFSIRGDDPSKPKRSLGETLYLFTGLYTQYSRLMFTHSYDKPAAIAGLEQRLTQVFSGQSGAGVFKDHWGRWLLWQSANGPSGLERLDFSAGTVRTPPSWSWQAHRGPISFINPPQGGTTWNKYVALTLTGDGKISWLNAKTELAMKAPVITVSAADAKNIQDSLRSSSLAVNQTGSEILLILDCIKADVAPVVDFVVIGTVGRREDREDPRVRAYVLAVKKTSVRGAYERIGAGYLPNGMMLSGTKMDSMSIV